MSAEAIIKSQARKTLSKNWGPAIAALLIALIPLYMIDGTTTVTSGLIVSLVRNEALANILVYSIGIPVELIAGFLLSPAINGYVRAYYRCAQTQKMEIADVFFYFEKGRYGAALRLNLSLFLRLLLPTLILFLPYLIFLTLCVTVIDESFIGTVLYNDISFLLAVLSTTAAALYALRYFTVYAVSIDEEYASNKEIFARNRYIMRGHTGDAAKLLLSFTPWLLLCLTILPMLYVIPYMTQAMCISAKWFKQAADSQLGVRN